MLPKHVGLRQHFLSLAQWSSDGNQNPHSLYQYSWLSWPALRLRYLQYFDFSQGHSKRIYFMVLRKEYITLLSRLPWAEFSPEGTIQLPQFQCPRKSRQPRFINKPFAIVENMKKIFIFVTVFIWIFSIFVYWTSVGMVTRVVYKEKHQNRIHKDGELKPGSFSFHLCNFEQVSLPL